MRLKALGLLGVMFLAGTWVWAQPSDPSRLTIDRIFASDDFRGEREPMVRWLNKSTQVELRPAGMGASGHDMIRIDAASGAESLFLSGSKLTDSKGAPIRVEDFSFSQDGDVVLIYTGSQKVWRRNTRGDYWTYRLSTGKLVHHGDDAKPSTLMFAKISPDGKTLGYVRENNLYVEPIDGGGAFALTKDGFGDGSGEVINGTFDWVYEEEFDCRDGWRWSPDGKSIAYWQLDTRGVPRFTMIDNVQGKYPKLIPFAYPKTGERNSQCRIGVVSTTGGETRWLEIPGDTQRDFYLPRMDWTGRPGELMVQRINRLQNTKDYLLCKDSSGKAEVFHTDRDAAWVEVHDEKMAWGGRGLIPILSEKEGWRSLYLLSREGGDPIRVTGDGLDVIRVAHIDYPAQKAWFLASPDSASEQYLYCVSWGKGMEKAVRVTPESAKGTNDYQPGPDGVIALWTHSAFGKPPVSNWIELATHKILRPHSTGSKTRIALEKLARGPVEFFKVDIGEGSSLDGWLMKPPGFDPAKKYPILFHIYGEPAGQTVLDRWGGNNYLWHLMLTQKGYLVASIDNRGTHAPKGRTWRKSIYKNIGTLPSADQAHAARELLKRPYVDAQRVGAWGWSGGGSMTLNLLFRHPEIYQTGMAVAPVPDMTLYDTIYQERYMGLPQTNPKEYATGSPIHHASGLRGNLLLVHGTGDDNVHYQGTEKLMDKLIGENKPFTLMAYPNRSHSVSEGKNTTRHLYNLLTDYLTAKMPAGPKP